MCLGLTEIILTITDKYTVSSVCLIFSVTMAQPRTWLIIIMQVVIWSSFLILPYYMVPQRLIDALQNPQPMQALPSNWAVITLFSTMPFNISLIVVFYLHHYVLFDKLVLRKKQALYFAAIGAMFVLTLAIGYYSKFSFFSYLPEFQRDLSIRDFVKYLTWFMLVLLASLGLKLLSQWNRAEKRASEIENERLRTELSMLLAQINPHFLFNSLNTVYSLTIKKSDAAPEAVLKLSHLFRYVIEDGSNETVNLEQEINYLNNYIDMQKLRVTPNTPITFDITGNPGGVNIAPLLYLPLVENAFKYGISNSEPSGIDIKLNCLPGKVVFNVTNRKFEVHGKRSTGIGLNNVRRRLELLYPDNHSLEINETIEVYSVTLTINTG